MATKAITEDESIAGHTPAPEPERTYQFDLAADFGLRLPQDAACVDVELHGDRSSFVIDIERKHKWTVEGQLDAATVTGVLDDGRNMSLPRTVPDWLALVVKSLPIGINEVGI